MVHVGSNQVQGKVTDLKKDKATLNFFRPICCFIGDNVALSRKIDKVWRLIGWGKVTDVIVKDDDL